MFLELKKPQLCRNASLEEQLEYIASLKNGIKKLSEYDPKKTEDWKINEIIWYNYDMNIEEGYRQIADRHLRKCSQTFPQDKIRTEYYKIEEEYERVLNPYYIDPSRYCPLSRPAPIYEDRWANITHRTILTQCVSGESCYVFYNDSVPTQHLKHYIESGELVLFGLSCVTSKKYTNQFPPRYKFHTPTSDFNSLLLCNCKLSMTTDSLGPYKKTFLSLFREFLTKEQIEKDIKTLQQWLRELEANAKLTAKDNLSSLDSDIRNIKKKKQKIKTKLTEI